MITKLLICVAVIVPMLFSGCAGLTGKPEIPAGCEDSLLYRIVPNPAAVDTLLALGVFEFVKHNPKARRDIERALDFIDVALADENLTYLGLATLVAGQADGLTRKYGAEILVISEILRGLDREIPMSTCDRELIRAHVAKQKRYLALLN